jgi:hypothetical protein
VPHIWLIFRSVSICNKQIYVWNTPNYNRNPQQKNHSQNSSWSLSKFVPGELERLVEIDRKEAYFRVLLLFHRL